MARGRSEKKHESLEFKRFRVSPELKFPNVVINNHSDKWTVMYVDWNTIEVEWGWMVRDASKILVKFIKKRFFDLN